MTFKSVAQTLSPRALWLPGDGMTDESGNGYTATNNGGTASSTGGPGDGLTSYMSFDGNDYLDLTTVTGFAPNLADATVVVWVRTSSTAGSTVLGTFNDAAGSTAFQVQVNYTKTQSAGPGFVRWGSVDEGGNAVILDGGNAGINNGNWHMIVVRCNNNQPTPVTTFRVDGVNRTSDYNVRVRQDDGFANFDNFLTAGARNLRGTIDQYFTGDIAAIALFDTNLTNQQADDLYDASFEGAIEVAVGTAAEAETANPITASKPISVDLGTVSEAERANPITASKPIFVDLGIASESELGQLISPSTSRQVVVGQATEAEAANPITPVNARFVNIGQATETELAQAFTIIHPRSVPVGTATEIELGLQITPSIFVPGLLAGIECEIASPSVTCSTSAPSITCSISS